MVDVRPPLVVLQAQVEPCLSLRRGMEDEGDAWAGRGGNVCSVGNAGGGVGSQVRKDQPALSVAVEFLERHDPLQNIYRLGCG